MLIKVRSGNIRLLAAHYALALAMTAIALAATLVLRRDGPTPSFLFFVPAVAISAWYGGVGPSALVTVLSLVLIDINFFAPGGSLRIDRIEALEIIAFLIVSVTITATMKGLQNARLLAESRAAELKRLNEEVGRSYSDERERRRVAELMAEAREEVLGVVAHDLRNPLNIIVSSADLLLQEQLDRAKKKQLLTVMLRAGKQMNRLIADLLDTVRLQAGKFTLDLEEVPVKTIFRQTEEAFRPLAANRSIQLVAVPPSDDVLVRADPFRVTQIIGNLLGNALKFTPEQGVVTLRASPNGHNVAFHVTDTGPGIPPGDVEHLFDNFWQARNDDHRGVGLGLPIAKGMVEAHGGMIWCETSPGQGSTFSFTLPRAEAAA
ncbi:MAG TPA: HAMP domain-containing sensor histidine kinase [Gemmatimonadaceae bacterium]|nr:HAMP domain-containing sensor histidine kinase [Gemmatimonadaceae bacterium]